MPENNIPGQKPPGAVGPVKSDEDLMPSGFTRGEIKMIIALGRYMDKTMEDYLETKEREGVPVRNNVIVQALSYVTKMHDAKVNRLGENVLFMRKLFKESGLSIEEPWLAESEE